MTKEAKTEPKKTIAEKRNISPENALRQDWPSKHRQLAPYITMKGKVRGNIGLKEQAKAKKILKDYGFEVE